MKKPLLSILVALSWATTASAQVGAVKPSVAGAGAVAALATKPAKVELETNPFTGRPMSVEQAQRELEETKLRTQMLEEVLKQKNLDAELNNLPLRKSVEAAQAETAVKKEKAIQLDIEEARRAAAREAARKEEAAQREAKAAQRAAAEAARAEAEAKKKAKAKPKSKAAEAEEDDEGAEQKQAQQMVPRAPKITLVSVLEFQGERSAVLDFNGNTLVVKSGDMTPVGPLVILDNRSAELNGARISVHSATLGRFVASDKATEAAGANRSAPATTPAPATQAPAQGANSSMSLPTQPAQRTTLPPLQLPPGVSVLPAASR